MARRTARPPRTGAFGTAINLGSITLCMIVRDEEAVLRRCLGSVRGIIDEVVIVDTGSKDGTLELARDLAPKTAPHGCVVTFDWSDDFAAARNESLRYAHGEWLLILDADEWLVWEGLTAEDFRRGVFALHKRIAMISIPLVSLQEDGALPPFPAARILRNRPDLRYEGKLHESPLLLDVQGDTIFAINRDDNIRIMHSGYTTAAVSAKRKRERNLGLARGLVRQGWADRPGMLVTAGGEMLRWVDMTDDPEGLRGEARAVLLRAVELFRVQAARNSKRGRANRLRVSVGTVNRCVRLLYEHLGERNAALELTGLFSAEDLDVWERDNANAARRVGGQPCHLFDARLSWYFRGRCLLDVWDAGGGTAATLKEAESSFREASRSQKGDVFPFDEDPWVRAESLYGLGAVRERLGDFEGAAEAFREALLDRNLADHLRTMGHAHMLRCQDLVRDGILLGGAGGALVLAGE